ncbi:hypothetical protein [Streptomyces sp. NPDC005549]|uniref:hypothetical protein n=1 Tax=Streptomyces sp. NPDC005549 TaxID=3154888 RepID=UPI0033A82ECA
MCVHRLIGAPASSRVIHTGWATGLDGSVVSALHGLHGLHGWDDGSGTLRAPQGTACTRWAQVSRLAGRARGTTVHVCPAALTAEPLPLEEAVTGRAVEHGRAQVVWALDRARSVIAFGPMVVSLLD